MSVVQSHALLLEEMRKLHVHLTDKLTTHFECIKTTFIDLLTFRANMEWHLTSFHDRFQSMETNIQEITDILKMWEEVDEFEMVAKQAPLSPSPTMIFVLLSLMCPLVPISPFFFTYLWFLSDIIGYFVYISCFGFCVY